MEDAKITQDQTSQEPLYQQGRYPSIIDTDDLVFELGKQTVNHLNHEKLIGKMIKQIESLQRENLQLRSTKTETVPHSESKIKQLEESNKLYEENNRKLGNEIVKLRNQITQNDTEVVTIKNQITQKEILVKELNNKTEATVKNHQKELFDIIKIHEEVVTKLQSEIASVEKKSKKKINNGKHNSSA